MVKVIHPITCLAGQEGEAADMIHGIAVEMMRHRADLLRCATRNTEDESQVYLNQARLFGEYATALDAIYFQMEPERWDLETSGEMLELAQAHHIALPEWMLSGKL